MGIEVIPLSRLQNETSGVLARCCDSGSPVVVELPDHRLVSIRPLDAEDETDSIVHELLESSQEFRDLIQKSAAASRRPFKSGS